MSISEQQLEKLRPYLAGAADPAGEVDMYCVYHIDTNRSARINVNKEVWHCYAGCGGGSFRQLFETEDWWIPMEGRSVANHNGYHHPTIENGNGRPVEPLSAAAVYRWAGALKDNEDESRKRLWRLRGINYRTAESFAIGWDSQRRVYTIPVRDGRGKLVNVRRYNPTAPKGRRKIWGIRGRNTPRLYPLNLVRRSKGSVIICEGEWDALVTIQNGFSAITRTGAAHVWKPEWNDYFRGRDVFVCHDCDEMGDKANARIQRELRGIARKVLSVALPYPWKEKHGFDLSDFWLDGGTPAKFQKMLTEAHA